MKILQEIRDRASQPSIEMTPAKKPRPNPVEELAEGNSADISGLFQHCRCHDLYKSVAFEVRLLYSSVGHFLGFLYRPRPRHPREVKLFAGWCTVHMLTCPNHPHKD